MMSRAQKVMWTLRGTALVAVCLYLAWHGWSRPSNGQRPAPNATGATRSVSAVPASNERLVTLEVGGMVCADCVQKVQGSLAHVSGVRTVDVNLKAQRASVICSKDVADTTLTAAVRHAGEGYLGLVVQQ